MNDDVRQSFTRRTGHEPLGIWSAPGRVNLIGEHTDYNDGFVLPFAIDRRTTVALGLRDDQLITVSSSASDQTASLALPELDDAVAENRLRGWTTYPLGVAWALGREGADFAASRGVDIVIESNVPIGSGLSSSAALECAVAVALNEVWGLGLSRGTLASVGQHAENSVVGAPTGIMDQSASLLAQQDSAVFLDCRTREARAVDFELEKSGLAVLVIDTRVRHSNATGGYRDRRTSCEAAARALGVAALRDLGTADLDRARNVLDDLTFRRVRHIVTENARVLETVATLESAGPLAIGDLLDASHVSMRDDFEISSPELDLAVETSRSSGAIGARMTGGGFGGAAIALVPVSELDFVGASVRTAFSGAGFGTPDLFVVTASEGARRDS